jgi:hypothetical protein
MAAQARASRVMPGVVRWDLSPAVDLHDSGLQKGVSLYLSDPQWEDCRHVICTSQEYY